MPVSPLQMVGGAAVILASALAEESHYLGLKRIQTFQIVRVAVAECRQQVLGKAVVGSVVAKIKQHVRRVETALRKGSVHDLHLRDGASGGIRQDLLLLRGETPYEFFPPFHRRDPAVTLAEQADEEGPGAVDAGRAYAQYLAFAFFFAHVRCVHSKPQVDGLQLNPTVAEAPVEGWNYPELDNVPFEVHVFEGGRNENIVSAPGNGRAHSVKY